jgi:hypothetical protein
MSLRNHVETDSEVFTPSAPRAGLMPVHPVEKAAPKAAPPEDKSVVKARQAVERLTHDLADLVESQAADDVVERHQRRLDGARADLVTAERLAVERADLRSVAARKAAHKAADAQREAMRDAEAKIRQDGPVITVTLGETAVLFFPQQASDPMVRQTTLKDLSNAVHFARRQMESRIGAARAVALGRPTLPPTPPDRIDEELKDILRRSLKHGTARIEWKDWPK